ncbi:MAG: GFA family protein [Pseudomonadales bacterium]
MLISKIYKGGCLCKNVNFEIHGDLTGVSYCHCSICRKASGTGSGVVLCASPEHLVWTAGEEQTKTYALESEWSTTFCLNCGSAVPQCHSEQPLCFVPAGSLDDDPGVAVMGHIYVGSKMSWDHIGDEAPQYDENYT